MGLSTAFTRRPCLPACCARCARCRYSEGLEYIRGLPRQEAAAALQKYGKVGGAAQAGRHRRGGAALGCTLLL